MHVLLERADLSDRDTHKPGLLFQGIPHLVVILAKALKLLPLVIAAPIRAAAQRFVKAVGFVPAVGAGSRPSISFQVLQALPVAWVGRAWEPAKVHRQDQGDTKTSSNVPAA